MTRRSSRAMPQRYKSVLIGDMVTKERARLPCGCCVFVGRLATPPHAVTTAAQPCSEGHQVVTDLASELIREHVAGKSGGLLVDACARMLSQAARQAGL